MDRLKDETRMMGETNNPLMKAMHFRNGQSDNISSLLLYCIPRFIISHFYQTDSVTACKAHEDIDYSGYKSYKAMPLQRDMVMLKNGLYLCSLGTVWTKTDKVFGNDHVLLGSASVMAGNRGDLIEKNIVTEQLKPVAFDGLRP